jgi:hypothetical protein
MEDGGLKESKGKMLIWDIDIMHQLIKPQFLMDQDIPKGKFSQKIPPLTMRKLMRPEVMKKTTLSRQIGLQYCIKKIYPSLWNLKGIVTWAHI